MDPALIRKATRRFIEAWKVFRTPIEQPSRYRPEPRREILSAINHIHYVTHQWASEATAKLPGNTYDAKLQTLPLATDEQVIGYLGKQCMQKQKLADKARVEGQACMVQWYETDQIAYGSVQKDYINNNMPSTQRFRLRAYVYDKTAKGKRLPMPVRSQVRTWHQTMGKPAPRVVIRVDNTQRPYLERLANVGPLRINKGSKATLVGRIHTLVGTRPQKFVRPVTLIERYFNERDPWRLANYSCPNPVTVCGAYDTNRHHIQAMADRVEGRGTYKNIIKALHRAHRLDLASVSSHDGLDAILGVRVKKQAYPGHDSNRLGRNREEVAACVATHAQRIYDNIKVRPTYPVTVYEIGGRAKREKKWTSAPLKSRAILMPETLALLVSSPPSQAITLMLAHSKSEVFVGRSANGQEMIDKCDMVSKWKHGVSRALDFSAYDTSVGERLVVAAFGVLSSVYAYGEQKQMQNVLLHICATFLDKHVLMPSGYVYRIVKGTPSGHPWTTLINSVVNWLIQVTVHDYLGIPDSEYEFEVAGDDVRIHYKHWWLAPSLDAYTAAARSMWGMKVKEGSVTTGYIYSPHVMSAPDFLATRMPLGLPLRDFHRLLDISYMPEKPHDTIGDQWARLRYMDRNFPTDPDVWKYHWDYFRWLRKMDPIVTGITEQGLNDMESEYWVQSVINMTKPAWHATAPVFGRSRDHVNLNRLSVTARNRYRFGDHLFRRAGAFQATAEGQVLDYLAWCADQTSPFPMAFTIEQLEYARPPPPPEPPPDIPMSARERRRRMVEGGRKHFSEFVGRLFRWRQVPKASDGP